MVFAGSVNEPATVTIQGAPAVVDATNQFRGTAALTSGTNTVTIAATDPSGNSTTRQWTVTVAGQAKTFTYDANGNLTADGTRTFEWDARNQLVAVTVGTHRSEFTYDGRQRRVRVVEKESGVVQSDTKVLWCQSEICEERAVDGVTVTRRVVAQGEQIVGTARFFATDHLGSVREVTDSTAALLTRYAIDPWGQRTVSAGSDVTKVAFTGHSSHGPSNIALAMYRGYDPALARWISADPIGFDAGPNSYAYVGNRPTVSIDPDGRLPILIVLAAPVTAGASEAALAALATTTAAVIAMSKPKWPYVPPITIPTIEVPSGPPMECPTPPEDPCVIFAMCLQGAKGAANKARCLRWLPACLASLLPS